MRVWKDTAIRLESNLLARICTRARWAVGVVVPILPLILIVLPSEARALDFEARVRAQWAIERVYWKHRIWPEANPTPKPPLESVLSEEAIRSRVARTLAESERIEVQSGRDITMEDLEAEVDRMLRASRAPDVLQELFESLGNDRELIAETLARATLARTTQIPEGGACVLDTWSVVSTTNAPEHRFFESSVWTGAELIVWGGRKTSVNVGFKSGGRYDPATDTWAATSTGINCPAERFNHSAVWTGLEMIVWGGQVVNVAQPINSGGRYNPTTDAWAPTSSGTGAPSVRAQMFTIWSGSEMIVWGGWNLGEALNTGARYSPQTDSWTTMSVTGDVPEARIVPGTQHSKTGFWTGSEFLIWGGQNWSGAWLNTGGRYDPLTDTWAATSSGAGAPLARSDYAATWTGDELIIWGGVSEIDDELDDGARYDPRTDNWIPIPDAPKSMHSVSSVWTGSEMVVWGGNYDGGSFSNRGFRYRPSSATWLPTSISGNVPAARAAHSLVWTGSQLLVWGGLQLGGGTPPTGGLYCLCPEGSETYFRDADGDGYGNPDDTIVDCSGTVPSGYGLLAGDCLDTDPTVHPNQRDATCNGIDNDCDGLIDEDVPYGCAVFFRGYDLAAWCGDDSTDLVSGDPAVLVGDATCSPGIVGNAFSFLGAGFARIAGRPIAAPTQEFSVESWIRPAGVDIPQTILGSFEGPGDLSFRLSVQPGGKLRASFSGDGSGQGSVESPGGLVEPDTFTHVAATFDSGFVRLYVNGNIVAGGTLAFTVVHAPGGETTIGGDGSGNEGFVGWIDEVAIYARALWTGEIRAIRDAGTSGMCRSCVPRLKLAQTFPISAAGVAWGDYDADGDPDLYVVGRDQTNRLYRNDGGAFVDATTGPLDIVGNGASAAWGDYDNDGVLDLAASDATGARVFRNQGDGTLIDVTTGGLTDPALVNSTGWSDVDRDGDLDLAFANSTGQNSSKLYRNDVGTFSDVTPPALDVAATGLAWGDANGDGWPDLYLSGGPGKLGASHLLQNLGGTLSDATVSPLDNPGAAGNDVEWVDFDGDGDFDLFLGSDAQLGSPSRLLRNAPVEFIDVTASSGIEVDGQSAWADYDNDGHLDLYARRSGAQRIWRDDGAGVLSDVTTEPFKELGLDGGAAWADVDGDGFLDLAVASSDSIRIYRRIGGDRTAHWLQVDLQGSTSNHSGIGAVIRVVAGGRSRSTQVVADAGYLGQSSITAEFGLGETGTIDSLIVLWPSGLRQVVPPPVVDQRITVLEAEVVAGPAPSDRPLEFALGTNRPNPFSISTQIIYELPSRSDVRLELFDLAGRHVRTLVNESRPAGSHFAIWDGRRSDGERAAPGVYFSRLRSGSLETVGRLVLVP